MERAIILGDLVKEILGPRNGAYESLPQDLDPRNEYIVGVLSPKNAELDRDIDSEAELQNDGDTEEQDIDEEPYEAFVPSSPSLDPKSLPRSMGISFVADVESEDAQAWVCFTWARYILKDSSWIRTPHFNHKKVSLTHSSNWSDEGGSGVEFFTKTLKLADGRYKISIFLVNNTLLVDAAKPNTTDFIFQPEIRINRLSGFEICNLDDDTIEDSHNDQEFLEEESLKLLYKRRTALARGHLVGATWKEIDIQRDHPKLSDLGFPPFLWCDGSIVPEDIRERFRNPDLRTDYTPTYPMEAPDMTWRREYGPEPEFNPEILSEIWEPDELREKLTPMVDGYKIWLKEQRDRTMYQDLSPQLRNASEKHFELIESTITRIDRSINLLCDSEDVRLSFCFANKVMALQSKWANQRVFPWRPFQLAFILLNISAIADDNDPDRGVADLLWFATGGGKTESYLGLAAFTIALERRRAKLDRSGHKTGSGVNVLSRYTLRLLTIQQFRRALRVITAAEYLRVDGLLENGRNIGWRPSKCKLQSDFIWGGERISIGLWVGGSVTPNGLQSFQFPNQNNKFIKVLGALDLLKNRGKQSDGEPAQVLNCPCCNSYVAIPNEGLGSGVHTLHLLFKASNIPVIKASDIYLAGAKITEVDLKKEGKVYYTISIKFETEPNHIVESEAIDDLWNIQIKSILNGATLVAARPTRPGYFFQTYFNMQGKENISDFVIICPNPSCDLNSSNWAEKVPVSVETNYLSISGDTEFQDILEAFKIEGEPKVSSRVIIPAYTVDDQIYHRCPTIIIATADKFAQLPSEPKASSIFGNVEYYHARTGYYRETCIPNSSGPSQPDSLVSHPSGYQRGRPLHKKVEPFNPPQLIIQDELHLIEGPLGSLYGLYETIIDELCTKQVGEQRVAPKYVVSTATVRQAEKQVKSLFGRDFSQFPPSGESVDDNFFSTTKEIHPLDTNNAGRLYVGVCAPGKGAQTPLVRIWSSLLQVAHEIKNSGIPAERIDGFLTVVGYFNALRELAGAASLYRQDIPERMGYLNGANSRTLNENPLELSSRKSSTELPGLLELLGNDVQSGTPEDGVLATSMFGTGVDVDRLRLMIINGQPKSTSSYIQASGRVGRKQSGLVVAFFRASRPRDLDHYEFFTGYHRALYKYVEPVTVAPFSSRAREKAFGPLSVALLRNAIRILGSGVSSQWRYQQKLKGQVVESGAINMRSLRHSDEVSKIIQLFVDRAAKQPVGRTIDGAVILSEIRSELDRWYDLSLKHSNLLFNESTMVKRPSHPVILGDPQHYFQGLDVAYENAPQSLRDVEGTTNFKS
ncbi:DISARM system helicase DrmA [Paenibacillus taichungensis]|uniref:DISARM system helicase DrmA n=1 Tax=Paenibacillus taichungensis TaxID=484184 RepID=UPI0028712014|nr:DISARM system helicase DrmA [Paenibacillus taichungensis]MDR9749295.1 DISARM system helicase DrmA [Paenibacillus taichungensis]